MYIRDQGFFASMQCTLTENIVLPQDRRKPSIKSPLIESTPYFSPGDTEPLSKRCYLGDWHCGVKLCRQPRTGRAILLYMALQQYIKIMTVSTIVLKNIAQFPFCYKTFTNKNDTTVQTSTKMAPFWKVDTTRSYFCHIKKKKPGIEMVKVNLSFKVELTPPIPFSQGIYNPCFTSCPLKPSSNLTLLV